MAQAAADNRLTYRTLVLVCLGLNRQRISPDHWTYFPGVDVVFGRSHEMTDTIVRCCGTAWPRVGVFLQNAVFFLEAYPLLFLFHVLHRQVPRRTGLYFLAAFALTCLPFVGYPAATGSIDDHLITNSLLNVYVGASRARVGFLSPGVLRDVARNVLFWVFVIGTAATLLRRGFRTDYAVPACLGLGRVPAVRAQSSRWPLPGRGGSPAGRGRRRMVH